MSINITMDPQLLLSIVNTKLRNHYPTLEALCKDLNLDEEALKERLKSIEKTYHPETHQFVSLDDD